MPKRPRRSPRIREDHGKYKQDEFRDCEEPRCKNIVSVEGLPRSYSGPVFCSIHRDRYTRT